MKKENKKAVKVLFSLVITLIFINFILAEQSWPAFNVCCEKTKNGAWCQNTPEKNCDTSADSITGVPFRKTPTSCDATSFCKMGCCIDSEEGLCMENTPQKVCQISTGTWADDAKCNVPQCKLGCCILGDQASFVTLTRCKRLSNIYGLKTDFRNNVISETNCISLAYTQEKGACVYEFENQKTCRFTTRGECSGSKKSSSGNITSETEFYPDFLCSADELGTNCGPTTETMCLSGRDEVYFRDSCGNPANIYDANKIYSKNPSYWRKVVKKSDSCGAKSGKGNANSKSCGNCNYLEGSICGKGEATYGKNYCKDVNCYNTENGQSYKNGESWCVYQGAVGQGQDTVGSRHFRHVCVHGEETIEPCADFRNEVCIENRLTEADFIEAGCRVNRWQDCIDQSTEKKCLNKDKRDCYWISGFAYEIAGRNAGNLSNSAIVSGNSSSSTGIVNGSGICLPDVPPGFKFWENGDAKVCGLANSVQTVSFQTNFFGSKSCKGNCGVLEQSWVDEMNKICTSLGDCGAKTNFIGKFTEDGIEYKQHGGVAQGFIDSIKNSAGSSSTSGTGGFQRGQGGTW